MSKKPWRLWANGGDLLLALPHLLTLAVRLASLSNIPLTTALDMPAPRLCNLLRIIRTATP